MQYTKTNKKDSRILFLHGYEQLNTHHLEIEGDAIQQSFYVPKKMHRFIYIPKKLHKFHHFLK
jgi:hypothetical protein